MSQPSDPEALSPSKEKRRVSFLDIGGNNSINNFASSYRRAQEYLSSEVLSTSIDDDISPNTSPSVSAPSLIDDEIDSLNINGPFQSRSINEFHFPPSSRAASSDTQFSIDSKGPRAARTGRNEHLESVDETTSLLSHDSSGRKSVVLGSSTLPQTVFNSMNSLMGMAMLSLPFGFKLSGWIAGTFLYLVSTVATNYTAKILGRIIHKHPQVRSYGDIAYLYGGKSFSVIVTAFFSIDLCGAILSLILLFSDSFNILVPSVSKSEWKLIIVSSVFFLSFLPLSILSLFSLAGIFGTISIIGAILLCGIFIDVKPGSLLDPEITHLFPASGMGLLLTLGIFMAPWGGHPVFPELYNDMKHPGKYSKSTNISFSLTFLLTYMIGVIGYLMYGAGCEDSIVKNFLNNPQYPKYIKRLFCFFMGVLPVAKLPLISKPLITVYESVLNIKTIQFKDSTFTSIRQNIKKIAGRFAYCVIILSISLLFNSFGKLVAFLGSGICFTICVTLPFMFYLKFFGSELGYWTKVGLKLGILLSLSGAILGTYASITLEV